MKTSAILLSTLAVLTGSISADAAKFDIAKLEGDVTNPLSYRVSNRSFSERASLKSATDNSPVAGPDMEISKTSAYGFFEGTNGSEWLFTQSFEESATNAYFYGATTISIYDDTNKKRADVTITIPDDVKVNQIAPFGKITTTFFDSNSSTFEFFVLKHIIVQPGVTRYDISVYNSKGEEVKTFEGAQNVSFYSYGEYSWDMKERLSVATDNDGEMNIDVYRKATYSDDTAERIIIDHTFTLEESLLNYSDGLFFDTKYIDGDFYYVLSHYEKKFVKSTDYNTGNMTFTPDNNYVTEVYNSSYTKIGEIKIPVVHESGATMPTMHMYGTFSTFDLTKGLFTGDDNINVIITHYDYDVTTDSYLYSYDAYNQDGTVIKHIQDNVGQWFQLGSISGQDEQVAFIKDNAGQQFIDMVDFPSCEIATTIPSMLDGKTISSNLDRVPAGDTYKYVIGLRHGEVDGDGNVIAGIAWYNKDLTLDRTVNFNLGTLAEMFDPIIYKDYLNPYLFDTDDEYEYIFIVKKKLGDGSEKMENVLCIANEDGSIIRDFGTDPEKGVYYSGAIVGLYSQNPFIYIVRKVDEKAPNGYSYNTFYNMDFFALPLSKFAGGEGTIDNPFLVASVGDLKQINNNPSAYYKLVKNLDLSNEGDWTAVNLNGGFDGDNHEISGLNIFSATDDAGLFGTVEGESADQKAYIKNLKINAPVIVAHENNMNVGAVAGFATRAEITNVYVIEPVFAWDDMVSPYTGGIVGDASNDALVADCLVKDMTVNLNDFSTVGGIVGTLGNRSEVVRCATSLTVNARSAIGGIAGEAGGMSGTGLIADCHSDATLKGDNGIGGIVGNSARVTVKNCYATGSITATAAEYGDYSLPIYSAGGIIGILATDFNSSEAIVVENCVALQTAITVEDEELGDATAKGVHRVVGTTCDDLDMGPEYSEIGIAGCYANDAMLINGETVETDEATSQTGVSKQMAEINKTFWESIGFLFGDNADAPWTDEALPTLYFEEGASSAVESVLDNNVNIYRNGNEIIAEEAVKINIYNLQGVCVASVNGSGVDVANLNNGLYIAVAFDAAGNKKVTKVVIK